MRPSANDAAVVLGRVKAKPDGGRNAASFDTTCPPRRQHPAVGAREMTQEAKLCLHQGRRFRERRNVAQEAERYTRAAERKRLAGSATRLLAERREVEK